MASSKLMMNLSSKDWDLTRRKSTNSSSSSTSTNHNHPRSAITNVNNQSPLETTFTPQEIARSCKQEVSDEMMTLEDYLARAGAVEEEDVKIQPLPLTNANVNDVEGFGFGIGAEEMGGRRKRRAISETFDKAAQQRQRRMIKNRESAARSRERKQAYQAELESLALKLEQENETLLKLKTEQTRKRYKQLMNNIIPVTEKQRPTRYVLRKVGSMEW